MGKFVKLFIISLIFIFSLSTIYSYSQVDLNLTLSSNPYYQLIQNNLINLGYFNRPVSGIFFLIIILLMSVVSFIIINLSKKNQLDRKRIIIIISSIIFFSFISYPAYSHDIFNYIFDARIVTKYHLNPYYYKALDFSSDPWIRFMHWTHRTYPYGPVWLIATLPFSYFGFNKFVLTLISFKMMFVFIYLCNLYLINKILHFIKSPDRVTGVLYFALNPLIIVETLISPHNESLVILFFLFSTYFILNKSKGYSYLSIFLSAGVKYTTVIFIPIFLFWRKIISKTGYEKILLIFLFVLSIPLSIQIYLREPYPWYFIPFIGITSLLPRVKRFHYYIYCFSVGFILRYYPFLFTGEYSKQNLRTELYILFIPPMILGIFDIYRFISGLFLHKALKTR
jgi:hypothetical protein